VLRPFIARIAANCPKWLAEKLASFLLEPRPKMPNMHAALKKQKISAFIAEQPL
jgi:hypothetical protein